MTQGQIEALSIAVEKAARTLEINIMKDIVRRMKANNNLVTSSAAYQIQRLQQMGRSDEYIKKELQTFLKISEEEMKKVYIVETEKQYNKFEILYKKTGTGMIPFSDNAEMQSLIQATLVQTNNTFRNLTNTTGFAKKVGGKTIFSSVAEHYWDTIDNALLGITTGAFDYNTAIKKAISDLTRSGLRMVDYESGRTYRVDSAARTALMTGFSQITQGMNEQAADALGINTFEVSYHIGARPSHQEWQGRVYTYEELENVCGLGQVTGLLGANCYHWYQPFIQGISERNYSDGELANMIATENKEVPYKDKIYTIYTGLQRQRKLELFMRKQREKIALLKEAKAQEFDILTEQIKYKTAMQDYTDLSEHLGLPTQKERIYLDGLGRVA